MFYPRMSVFSAPSFRIPDVTANTDRKPVSCEKFESLDALLVNELTGSAFNGQLVVPDH